MLEVGPTPAQARLLKLLDLDPEKYRNTPRDEITLLLRRKRIPRPGNPQATKETLGKGRMEEVRKKGLRVGMSVDVVRGNGVKAIQNLPIRKIADDGRVYLEGIEKPFFPQRIVPTGKGI